MLGANVVKEGYSNGLRLGANVAISMYEQQLRDMQRQLNDLQRQISDLKTYQR